MRYYPHVDSKSLEPAWKPNLIRVFNSVGLGSVNAQALISTARSANIRSGKLFVISTLANMPQIVLSCIYFVINKIFTSMLLVQEWNAFAHERKALRVSNPKGEQRSTYFLQMPFKYSMPLILLSASLQYFLSQSSFIARVLVKDIYEAEQPYRAVVTIGFSP